MDDDDESVFVVVRWQGSGASYFRSAQVDRTRRARPARSMGGGPDGSTPSARVPRRDDSNDARVRWDSRDGVSAFRNDACYLHPAATGGDRGEVHAFDSIADDDDDDDEPTRGTASSARHLPWEVRLAVCASRPGSIYGTTERVIGEGALNLADFVGTSKAGRGGAGGPTRVQLEMRPGSAATPAAAAAAETSSRPPPPRLSLSVAVTRSPGLASKAAASLGGKGSCDRAVAGKLFSYLSASPRGDREDRSGRRVGQGLALRSSPRSSDDASSDGFTSDGAMDTCESDAERGPSTPPRGSEPEFNKPPSGKGKDPRRHRGERRDDDDDDDDDDEEEEENTANDDANDADGNRSRDVEATPNKRHSRSWSWSVKWTSPVRRRRLGDDVNDAVVIDDELLPTPAKAGTSARKTTRRSAAQGSPPSSPEPHSEDKEEKEKKAVEKAENGDGRKTHRRTSSWSSRVFGGPFVSSFVGLSKTPEEVDAERAAREARRASKAADIAARKFARDESKRAKRELIRRATEEERMFRAVLEETKRAAAESLPRRRGESAAHAACVLVTPGGVAGEAGEATGGRGVGEGRLEPPVGPGGKRNLASALDDVADEATAPIGNAEVAGSNPDGDGATRSAARADHGEWLRVELRSQPTHPATATRSDTSDAAAAADEPAKIPANAFFASLDQMSANGQGACTLACVALAEWLEDHPGSLPTARLAESTHADVDVAGSNPSSSESSPDASPDHRGGGGGGVVVRRPKLVFDAVIAGAAAAWRALCNDASLLKRFPDRHFDLDTALERHVPFPVPDATGRMQIDASVGNASDRSSTRDRPRRLRVDHRESFVGFLTPPGTRPGDSPTLDALVAAAPPLRTIVDELARTAPATYVVSWLDHFFVLRFARERVRDSRDLANPNPNPNPSGGGEEDEEVVVYVMDSLGERLCEGCKRGYVLRFDGSSSTGRDGDGGGGAAAAARFIGEVLPSRLLRQIGADVAAYASGVKGAREPSPEQLMRRLQIEFHRVRRG